MADVSLDELLGFISMKVFCRGNPKRNLALRELAGSIVYQTNQYTDTLCRKGKKYTMPIGPAGAAMWTALRNWYGNNTPRCWSKMVQVFDDCRYFTVLNYPDGVSDRPAIIRLNVGMLINEAAAAKAAAVE